MSILGIVSPRSYYFLQKFSVFPDFGFSIRMVSVGRADKPAIESPAALLNLEFRERLLAELAP
jgi:hypothetical protein